MPGVYEIFVESRFAAAHSLKGYQGDCAQVHGHNWVVGVFIKCSKLNEIGIGIDFRDVKEAVNEIMDRLDHSYLNEYPEFHNTNPTSENIARYLYHELSAKINSKTLAVSKIRVAETKNTGACYWEE